MNLLWASTWCMLGLRWIIDIKPKVNYHLLERPLEHDMCLLKNLPWLSLSRIREYSSKAYTEMRDAALLTSSTAYTPRPHHTGCSTSALNVRLGDMLEPASHLLSFTLPVPSHSSFRLKLLERPCLIHLAKNNIPHPLVFVNEKFMLILVRRVRKFSGGLTW